MLSPGHAGRGHYSGVRVHVRGPSRLVLGENTNLLAGNVAEHEAVLEAIERGDAEAARALMHLHVLRAGALVTHRFEQREVAS